MKASDLFVKCLEMEGVKYIFGLREKRWKIFFSPSKIQA